MGLNLYRTKLGGPIERLTPARGSYGVTMSPDGGLFLASWSDIKTPTSSGCIAPTASSCARSTPTPRTR